MQLSPEQASEFYSEHFGKMFFAQLVTYMSSGPVLVLVLAGENAIARWREMIGPTNALKAKQTHPTSFASSSFLPSFLLPSYTFSFLICS